MKRALGYVITVLLIGSVLSSCGGDGISSPEKNTIWESNKEQEIEWKVDDINTTLVDIVLIDHFRDETTMIAADVENTGDHTILLPAQQLTGGDFQIQISDAVGDAEPLTSSGFFIEPWDWYQDRKVEVSVTGREAFESVRLPYYEAEGPVRSDIRPEDMHPKQGWTLLLASFGSAEDPVVFPRMFFYNRFSGVLRVFYYFAHLEGAWTKGMVRLQKKGAHEFPAVAALMGQKPLSRASDTDTLTYLGDLTWLTWNYADFVLGFDPDPPADSFLEFKIWGIEEGSIRLSGDVDLSSGNIGSGKPGLPDSLLDSKRTKDAAVDAWAMYGKVDDFVNEVREKTKEGGDWHGKWYTERLSAFASSPFGTALEYLAPLASFVMAMLGTGGPAPVRYQGTVNLSGELSTPYAFPEFHLRVPGADHSGDDDLPHYGELLGVVALRDAPVMELDFTTRYVALASGRGGDKTFWVVFDEFRHTPRLPENMVLVNPLLAERANPRLATIPAQSLPDFGDAGYPDGYYSSDELNDRPVHEPSAFMGATLPPFLSTILNSRCYVPEFSNKSMPFDLEDVDTYLREQGKVLQLFEELGDQEVQLFEELGDQEDSLVPPSCFGERSLGLWMTVRRPHGADPVGLLVTFPFDYALAEADG